jgi:DNA modification methylase
MSDIIQYKPATLSNVDEGWEVDDTCPIIMRSTRGHDLEEYAQQLERLQTVEGAVQFWQGDVANAGKKEYGYGAMKEIADELGLDYGEFRNNSYISQQTMSARADIYPKYPQLKFVHYRVVAPLEDDEQIKWLEEAGSKGLSAAELRKAIKGLDWEPRYFNHWSAMPIESWQNEYPGQIPGGILMNVLYYTTNKGDMIIDPFGGGGNMALACKQMGRNCITYDIDPKFQGMTKHNAVFPFPDSGAQLVFLDPPYWGQKKGEYATDPADLSNVDDAEQFHLLLEEVCKNAYQALKEGGYLALIIGASQTKDYYIDHAAEMYCRLRQTWKHINSIAAAYPTTQYSGNDMNHAKQNHIMLNLYTTIQIWKK